MRNALLLIALFTIAVSCDKFPDPSVTNVKDYSFYFLSEPGGKFSAGDWVYDSIVFKVLNKNYGIKDSVRVFFEILSEGKLTVQSAYTNHDAIAVTRWQLGTGSCKQVLRANCFDLSGNFLTSTDLVEYAFKNDIWNEFTGFPDGSMSGLVADNAAHLTFMTSNGSVFQQGEKYYRWNQIINPLLNSVRTINIDNNGTIYVSTYNGDLIKSTDHGKNWKSCTKPYSDNYNLIYIYISNDNLIWAFAWSNPIRFSKDGGDTWIETGSDLSSNGFGQFFRMKDGSLLSHGSNYSSLNRSFYNGLTWSKIDTPGNSLRLYVDDKDNVFLLVQEDGTSVYMSADNCATFTRIYNIPQRINVYETSNIFSKSGDYYFLCFPGYGIIRSTDLSRPDSYETYYTNSNLTSLYIDHNGALIGRGLFYNTIYYRMNSK
jgi:hypothetical protein